MTEVRPSYFPLDSEAAVITVSECFTNLSLKAIPKWTERVETTFKIAEGIILLGGTLANLLVFTLHIGSQSVRGTTLAVYACSLALTDTCLLWSLDALPWFTSVTGEPLPGPVRLCNLRWFLIATCSSTSTWITVVMTTERFVATYWPSLYKASISQKKVVAAVLMVAFVNAILYCPFLFSYSGSGESCIVHSNMTVFLVAVYPLLTAISLFIIPDLFFIIVNVAIVVRMRRLHTGTENSAITQRDRRMTITAVILSLDHVLLNLPPFVMSILMSFQLENLSDYQWALLLAVSLSARVDLANNLFIFLSSSSLLRLTMKQMFFKLFACMRHN